MAIAEVVVEELLLPLSNQEDASTVPHLLGTTAPWMVDWHCAVQLDPLRSPAAAEENDASAKARVSSMHRELKNLARAKEALRVNLNL